MKKKDLTQLAFVGISAGIAITSQTSVHADEIFSNTVSGHYLAAGCGSSCSAIADNGRGYSNKGYFYNQDQNQTYYYQQGPSESSRLEQSTRQRNRNQSQYQPQQYNYQQNQNNQRDPYYWQGSYENPGYLSSNDESTKGNSSESDETDQEKEK